MPDEYGCYQNNDRDFEELYENLKQDGTIVFPYSPNQIDAYIILLSESFTKLGSMPFGGKPDGRTFVGIMGRGCNHLDISADTHPNYLAEKLNLNEDTANHISELFEGMAKSNT